MANLIAIGVLAILIGQPAARGVAITGVVQDQTGAVLPGAAVTLWPPGAATGIQQTTTGPNGVFRFERVTPGLPA